MVGFIQRGGKGKSNGGLTAAPGKAKVRTSKTASKNLEEMDLIRVARPFEKWWKQNQTDGAETRNHTEELRIDTVEKWKTFKVLE